jgi:A/G-specific adenine glycosylase
MLQQTQVATVIPYFNRFLRRFPSVQSLANASENDVLRLWEGLGYYRRARDLRRAARLVRDRHGGRIPNDPAALAALPGIGRYMVGAILSQAHDLRLPIVEANSERVLSRLLALRDNPRKSAGRRQLWLFAEKVLPRTNVGEFNQAIMELGALVCTPMNPRCNACPIRSLCAAGKAGNPHAFPTRTARPKPSRELEAAIVLWRKNQVLVVQRPAIGRFAGLWEFPSGAVPSDVDIQSAAAGVLFDKTGLKAKNTRNATVIPFAVNHHQIRLNCVEAVYAGGTLSLAGYDRALWRRLDELAPLAFSRPHRLLARFLDAR